MRRLILKSKSGLRELGNQAVLSWLALKLQVNCFPKAWKEAPRYFQVFIAIAVCVLIADTLFFIYICWQVKMKEIDSWERWSGFFLITALTDFYWSIALPLLQWRLVHPTFPRQADESMKEELQWRLKNSTLPDPSTVEGGKEWRTLFGATMKNMVIWNVGLIGGLALGAVFGLIFSSIGLLASVLVEACRAIGQRFTGLLGIAVNQHATRSMGAAAEKERQIARAERKSISRKQYQAHLRQIPQVRRAQLATLLGIALWIGVPAVVILIAVRGVSVPIFIGGVLVVVLTALTIWGSKVATKPAIGLVAFRLKTSYWPRTVQDVTGAYSFSIKQQKLTIIDSFVAPSIYSVLALLMDGALGNEDPLIHSLFLGVWATIGALFLSSITAIHASEIGRQGGNSKVGK